MRSLLQLFLCVFLLSDATHAQSKQRWVILNSNEQLDIEKSLLNKLNQAPDTGRIKEIVTKDFFSRGFLNIRIYSIQGHRIYIEPGCVFTVGALSIQHEVELDTYTPYLQTGDRFTEKALRQTSITLTNYMEQKGYPFAEVVIAGLDIDRSICKVHIDFIINEGDQWVTEGIIFSNTERVGDRYLKKVSGYQDSVLITQTQLEQIQTNLINTNYFNSVSTPVLVENSGEQLVYVEVKEKNPNYFDGLVGYVPDPSGTGQVVGEAKLGLVNAISDGSELNILFQRLRPENTRLNVGFDQNWVGQLPLGIGGEFKFFQQDTNYQSRSFALKGSYQINRNIKLLGRLFVASVTANDENSLTATEVDGSRQIATLGFEYSTLNHPLVPTSGIKYSLSFGSGRKVVAPDDEVLQLNRRRVRQTELESEVEVYIPLKRNQVLALRGFGYAIEAQVYSEVDLLRFGGANSFRGYSEEQFFANRVGWGDLEYRYLINSDSYLFTFGTAGGFSRPQLITEISNQFRNSEFLYSFGFGLSYLTSLGQLKFSYGISPQDEISNGKVHFGIVTAL